ncbi:MAG TPA: SDR family NAD(P)-dependent oxidoreductase [Anaerovoracaceae bacterium]|nr:SDR family NAD(P)-dependent oxidoreductase [Anaerovoracaceae bacterium]
MPESNDHAGLTGGRANVISIDLSDKTVLLTGGDSPEARWAALRFAAAGANLVIQYEKEETSVGRVVDEIVKAGGKAEAFYADLGNYQDAERLTERIIKACRRIDILVNTFTHHSQVPFRELTAEQWNDSLQHNLFSVYHISRSVSRHMTEQEKGVIINITSAIHFSGIGGGVDFSAAEAAVHGVTLAMARELTVKGLRVNAIAPSADLLKDQDAVGNFAVFLASALADRISGEIFKLDGIPAQRGGTE